MAKKYLDYDGLLYFWQKIKTTFALASHNHTKSQITDFPTEMTPSSHTHGNIQNGGTLQTTDVGVANGDKLVITDASSSNKVARSSVAFDGSTENKALTPKGTWKEFNNYVHPTTTAQSASAKKVGNDANGHVVLGDALKTSDLTNDSGFITIEDVPAGVQPTTTSPKMDGTATVGSETAFARGDHVHPSDTTKVDKVTGKGLSTNDFTDTEKEKLASLPNAQDAVSVQGTGTSTYGETIGFSYGLGQGQETKHFYTLDAMNTAFSGAMTLLNGKVDATSVGQANGVAPLDANSKIDAQYLPSYVDDVIEAYPVSGATELSAGWLSKTSGGSALTPEAGVIYVLISDTTNYSANSQFRWATNTYVKLADGGVSSITNGEIDTIVAS